MNDWLVKFAQEAKSEDQLLHEALESLPPSMLQELAAEFNPSLRPTGMEAMEVKIANAHRMGQELAYEHGDELEKQAFLPVLAAGARMLGGAAAKTGLKGLAGGVAKNVAKDVAINGATKAVSSAVRPPATAATGGMTGGGFSYGKVAGLNMAGVGRQAAGFFHRNPGAALTLAGAAGGAIMAPRDPQTGEKQLLRGAVMGGGLAAGANALSQGRLADKAKHMVTRQNNPIFGQGARRYATESAYQTRPAQAAGAAAAAAPPVSGGGPASAPYRGGPTMGQVKLGFAGIDDVIGGLIGHAKGKQQAERGEEHNFGGKQVASLLLPGGAGYQLGRYIGHNNSKKDKEKTASPAGLILQAAIKEKLAEEKTDTDRAKKWGRTGALAGGVFTAARIPAAMEAARAAGAPYGVRPGLGSSAAMIGLGGAINAGLGYGAGRLAHRFAHGPATGKSLEKSANRSTLTYDPATKTFTRQNLTADTTMGSSGSDVIPAGHVEPAGRALREPARGPVPAGLGPSGGTSRVHSLHGGDVMSSSPRPGMAARTMGTPPPIPAAARRPMGGVAGLAGAAAKPKLPSLAGAMSLAGGLKKIATNPVAVSTAGSGMWMRDSIQKARKKDQK